MLGYDYMITGLKNKTVHFYTADHTAHKTLLFSRRKMVHSICVQACSSVPG
jgi:hypothetical protein